MQEKNRENFWPLTARLLATVPVAAVLILASCWAIRLALADYRFRASSLRPAAEAVRLDPNNARYWAALAEYQAGEGLDPNPALERAARLNPLDSSVWMHRGLRAEFERDYARAEEYLLEAARVDKLFDPRSTLMNYYFRRNQPEPFWRWAREAFDISYGDLTPLFRLCWRMSDDAELIRTRALGYSRDVLRAYLGFLLVERRLEAAEPVARQLAPNAAASDGPVLLDFLDTWLERRPIDRGRLNSALAVWNSLCIRNVLPLSPLEPLENPLTNGDFRRPLTARGFDWRAPQNPDISATRVTPRGLRIDLSGKQPERCELLAQYLPLSSGKPCRFRFEYQTSPLPPESGLRWRLRDASFGRDLLVSGHLSSPDWKRIELAVSAQDAALGRLALEYSRVPGTSRPEGWIALRDLEIRCAP